jgi:hypothetical protein
MRVWLQEAPQLGDEATFMRMVMVMVTVTAVAVVMLVMAVIVVMLVFMTVAVVLHAGMFPRCAETRNA